MNDDQWTPGARHAAAPAAEPDLALIPGPGPGPAQEPPTAPPKPKSRRGLGILGMAGALAAIALAGYGYQHLTHRDPFTPAVEACNVTGRAVVADGGKTLTLDGAGDKDGAGLATTDIACILSQLKVSTAVVTQMDNTRALDGRQSGTWGDFDATWTYHPDNGLDVIITTK